MLLDSGLALDCVGAKIVQYSLNFAESCLRACQKRQRQQEKKKQGFFVIVSMPQSNQFHNNLLTRVIAT